MNTTTLSATEARAMYPAVIGTIKGATLHSWFAILDMGPYAYGVMVRGQFRACCPTVADAVRAGEKFADEPAQNHLWMVHEHADDGERMGGVQVTTDANSPVEANRAYLAHCALHGYQTAPSWSIEYVQPING